MHTAVVNVLPLSCPRLNNAASQDKFTLPLGFGLCTSQASFSLLNINTDKLTNIHTQKDATVPTQAAFISLHTDAY